MPPQQVSTSTSTTDRTSFQRDTAIPWVAGGVVIEASVPTHRADNPQTPPLRDISGITLTDPDLRPRIRRGAR